MVWQDEKVTMHMHDGLAFVALYEQVQGVVLHLQESIVQDE